MGSYTMPVLDQISHLLINFTEIGLPPCLSLFISFFQPYTTTTPLILFLLHNLLTRCRCFLFSVVLVVVNVVGTIRCCCCIFITVLYLTFLFYIVISLFLFYVTIVVTPSHTTLCYCSFYRCYIVCIVRQNSTIQEAGVGESCRPFYSQLRRSLWCLRLHDCVSAVFRSNYMLV